MPRNKDLLMVNYDGYRLMAQTNLDALGRWPHLFNRTVEVKVRYLVKKNAGYISGWGIVFWKAAYSKQH